MIARFARGANRFDISASPYSLGSDFLPPAASFAYNFGGGGSSNRYGGGTLISDKAQDAPFNFKIRILRTSEGGVNAARLALVGFLKATSADDLYFEFSPYDLPETLWGQGLWRYKVLSADVSLGKEWTDAVLRTSGITVDVALTINSIALGKQQRLASATGAIWMDTIGSAPGSAWGLRIAPAVITNKFFNPVFGNLTWNTGWAATANIIEKQNTNTRYCYPGSTSSALLTGKGVGQYVQNLTLTVATYYFIAVVCRTDSAAVSSSDCRLYYNGAALSTTYRDLGDGKYLLYASAAGVAAPLVAGLQVEAGRSVYALAFNCTTGNVRFLGFGDQLGLAWTGTAHNSTSTCAIGRVRLAVDSDTFVHNLWTIHLVWKPDEASAAIPVDRYLFSCGSTNIRCTFTAADEKINLLDNTNTASTGALAFSAGDALDVIAVGGNSGLAIYVKNLTTGNTYSGTNATYTIPAAPSYIYIGTDDSGANGSRCIFQLFETYNDDLTSAQAAILQNITGGFNGAQVGDIPWLWTKDGDNIVDNCNDSTRDNFAVCAGIPGNLPAKTELLLGLDAMSATLTHWIGNHTDIAFWRDPSVNFWDEAGVTAEAGNSRGDYLAIPGGGGAQFSAVVPRLPKDITGKTHYFMRARSEAGTHSLSCVIGYLTNAIACDNPSVSFSMDTTYRLWYLGDVNINTYNGYSVPGGISIYHLDLYNVMDPGANSFRFDFGCYINGKLLKIECNAYTGAATSAYIFIDPTTIIVDGENASYGNAGHYPTLSGEIIELEPGAYNTLTNLIGAHGGAHDPSYTLTYTHVKVTPRWGLL